MQRLSFYVLLLSAYFMLPASPIEAAMPPTLTHVKQVESLSNSEAASGLPVQLQGTVTYVSTAEKTLFLSETGSAHPASAHPASAHAASAPSHSALAGSSTLTGSSMFAGSSMLAGSSIFVQSKQDIAAVPGDRVIVTGATVASFRTDIAATEIHVVSHGPLPAPKPAEFDELIQAKFDSQYVQITGRILSAAFDQAQPRPYLHIRLQMKDGIVEAAVINPGDIQPENLLDADVKLSGVAGGDFDSKMQMVGVWLDMNSWKEIEFLHPVTSHPWSLPITPLDRVINAFRYGNASHRVRVTGTLTYFEPASLAVVEADGKAMLLDTRSALPLHAGQGVEATGFPTVTNDRVRLTDVQLRASAEAAPIHPAVIDWEAASAGLYAYNLIEMQGKVVAAVHDSRVDMFVIESQRHLFSASMRHDSADASVSAPGTQALPTIGSLVRVTGICFVEEGNHWRDRLWFDLRMRSPADLAVVQEPSWWTNRRLAYLITTLSALILAAVIWVGFLDRRLREQTAIAARRSQEDAMRERQMARQEQQRSRILEMISSTDPLPEVLREIQGMVSARLYGAPCWFELNSQHGEAATLERPTGPAIVFEELFSPDAVSLGFLLTTPRLHSAAQQDIASALRVGARLAELAIDTRRLYTDLRHRSEYDLLTEIPNRFSMERQLNQLMENAHRTDAIFGLVYVDFDRFKQVNDRYGHRSGDLYLQEGVRRMKAQLRTGDVLARIGGDEFIALVPILRSRADAEEIAVRLERCFDDPFEIEGIRLLGSASVGLAVYPEDGSNEADLQRSADAAMYAHKESKKHREKLQEAMRRLSIKE